MSSCSVARTSSSEATSDFTHPSGHPVSSALGDPTDRACWPVYGLGGPAPMLVIGQGGLAPWAVVERDGASVSRCACWMSWPRRSMAFW